MSSARAVDRRSPLDDGAFRQRCALRFSFLRCATDGSRRIEFLHLTLPQIDSELGRIRLMRAKQHGGATRVESVTITAGMEDLIRRLRALPRPDECLQVFTTRNGNPYTDDGFASTWQRAMAKALADKIIPRRFTFHDPAGLLHHAAQGSVWSVTRVACRYEDYCTGVRPITHFAAESLGLKRLYRAFARLGRLRYEGRKPLAPTLVGLLILLKPS